MNKEKNVSRRNFIKNSSLGLGTGMMGAAIPSIVAANPFTSNEHINETKKLPREIRVASVDLKGLWPDTTRESRIKRILERMEEVTGMKPDLVCLPEMFDTSGNDLETTTEFVRYVWATINLEKVNVSSWPTNHALPGLFKKYGDKLDIKVWSTTDVITIESRDPGLKVLNVLKEFNIPTYADDLKNEKEVQDKYRPAVAKK